MYFICEFLAQEEGEAPAICFLTMFKAPDHKDRHVAGKRIVLYNCIFSI
jgi:hypothetical protein